MRLAELNDYIAHLKRFDWYYAYSDDHGVWLRGERAKKELQSIAKSDPLAQRAYDAVCNRYFSGDAFGSVQVTDAMLAFTLDEIRKEAKE